MRMRRWWAWVAVAAVVAGLALVGHLTAPPAAGPPAVAAPVVTGPVCDPAGITRRALGPTDGPQLRPPIAGLRLDPAAPRPGELGRRQAEALGITARARLLAVTRPPRLHRTPAWVVAVAGVPAGNGFCGLVGSREVVVVLDAVTGRELLRYSYR
jgi:hypothetical protein